MTTSDPAAFWITGAGQCEIRPVSTVPAPEMLRVKTLFSGISRGTEKLVFEGRVPEAEHETMRAPFQEGEFTFPVKYGYAAVGVVEEGARAGETVFSLFPHQTHFSLPDAAAFPLPEGVPAERAILAANMETALNIVWDAGVLPGDRVALVGCGVVGALTGYLAAQIPGTDVTMVDINPAKAAIADQLGCQFATPAQSAPEADVVIHSSATAEGLNLSISLAGTETRIVEASWYGDAAIELALGGAFHRKRLQIIGSQVGRIPASRAARWTFSRRLTKALDLLSDDRLECLISSESAFANLPEDYANILADPDTLCHRVRYGA